MRIRLTPLHLIALCMAMTAHGVTAQTQETVEQVTSVRVMNTNKDLVVSSATAPFTTSGAVNIVTNDGYTQALILKNIRPTKALEWLNRISIDGQTAQDSVNCMVKIYGQGTIILPRGYQCHPLSLYAAANQQQLLTNDLTVHDSHSLAGTTANNKAVSFRLRRGYMVCFGTRAVGTPTRYTEIGYNRIWVADKADLNVNLGPEFTKKVTFVRILQWNDVDKRGYSGNDLVANEALNTTWFYDWGAADAKKRVRDREFVAQRHGKSWPDMNTVCNQGTSPNVLGQNEPDKSDQANMTVAEALAIWPQLMATGKRLGAPVVASNYSGWLYPFLDSLEARGWRCDFIPLHCYWYSATSSWKSQLTNIYNKVKRPLWITEMNYGANWTGWPGSDTSGSEANYQLELKNWGPTITMLNELPFMERYAAYNWVQECRKLYTNTDGVKLTPMGEFYASANVPIGYDAAYTYTPPMPKVYDPRNFKVAYDAATHLTTISWTDPNGEFNNSMVLMRRRNGVLTPLETIAPTSEVQANYTYKDLTAQPGDAYCIVLTDYLGTVRSSEEIINIRTDDKGNVRPFYQRAGERVTFGEQEYFLGGNIIVNGDFDFGRNGWVNGAGTTVAQPDFQVIASGGVDGGAYLRAWNTAGTGENNQTIGNTYDLKANTPYHYTVWSRNNSGSNQRVKIYGDNQMPGRGKTVSQLTSKNNVDWVKETASFNTDTCKHLYINYSWLGYTSQYDKFYCGELFSNYQNAIADGVEKARNLAQAFIDYNKEYASINTELQQKLQQNPGNDIVALSQIEDALQAALQGRKDAYSIDSLLTIARPMLAKELADDEQLNEAITAAEAAATVTELSSARVTLQNAVYRCRQAFTEINLIVCPSFAGGQTVGWQTKTGTYQGGTQEVQANVLGKNYVWSALWEQVDAAEGANATLGISQQLNGLNMGFYLLACDATTQHYCLTDQHAYLATATDSTCSASLTSDRADIPPMDITAWETLNTAPVFVEQGGWMNAGFTSSKQGAENNAWISSTNKKSQREGWWMATDFRLFYRPGYERIQQNTYGIICLPFAARPSSEIRVFTIAGRTEQGDKVVLSEVQKMAAGVPYVYLTASNCPRWIGSGNNLEKPSVGTKGLRGAFKGADANLRNGYYVLVNDAWVMIDDVTTVKLNDYSGYLLSVADLSVTEETATSITIPVSDATTSGIENLTTTQSPNDEGCFYDLLGRKVHAASAKKGVFIRNGKKYVNH